ncbi:MAG TPA: 7TM-DISM domain-containing protein [Oligoflexus sp.]|uniref:7TM-DISM domain-containing protein n=1 Tax=Oligoflexus sp. TaxID=1971216 RepID=UPI002D6474C4|nr:7TM-DISM domain-containing protein [Oligoflexus sp.]HYX32299.1 7TM-DISM domain-containing protein [Oligoflexus sp.]
MNVLQYSILLCLAMVMNLSQRGEAATPIPFNLAAQKLDGQFMGESVEYFEDTGGKLDVSEVISRWAEWPILAGQKPVINLAFTPHPLWFRWAV